MNLNIAGIPVDSDWIPAIIDADCIPIRILWGSHSLRFLLDSYWPKQPDPHATGPQATSPQATGFSESGSDSESGSGSESEPGSQSGAEFESQFGSESESASKNPNLNLN